MKKILSVFLAVLMTFSFVGIFGASAANGEYLIENNLGKVTSVDELISANKSVYGMTVERLYSNEDTFDWSKFYVPYTTYSSEGAEVETCVQSGDIAMARGNINIYLKRFFIENYLDTKLYTGENATKIANFLGNLFYPNFKDVEIVFSSTLATTEDEFFSAIVEKSGFGDIIQSNWCDTNIETKSILSLFGVNLTNVLDREYKEGDTLAKKILEAAFQMMIEQIGPVNYFLDVFTGLVKAFTSAENTDVKIAVTYLFSAKYNSGLFDKSDISTLTGLMNAIFNDCDSTDTKSYQFIEMPEARLRNASGYSELCLFLLAYLSLNYNYANNASIVSDFLTDLDTYLNSPEIDTSLSGHEGEPAEVSADVKKNINAIAENILTGNVTMEFFTWSADVTTENISAMGSDFFTLLINSITGFFKRIAEWFDNWLKVLNGEKEYGKF